MSKRYAVPISNKIELTDSGENWMKISLSQSAVDFLFAPFCEWWRQQENFRTFFLMELEKCTIIIMRWCLLYGRPVKIRTSENFQYCLLIRLKYNHWKSTASHVWRTVCSRMTEDYRLEFHKLYERFRETIITVAMPNTTHSDSSYL